MKIILLPGLDGTGKLLQDYRSCLPASVTSRIWELPTDGPQLPKSFAESLKLNLSIEEPIFLLAESFSGPIAYQLIQQSENIVKGLILVSSFFSSPSFLVRSLGWLPIDKFPIRRPPAWALRWLCVGSGASKKCLQYVQDANASVPKSVVVKRIKALASLDEPRNAVEIPCLYLQPSDDRLVPKWHAINLGKICSNLRVRTVQGPHFLLQTRARECADITVEFLEEIENGNLSARPKVHSA